MAKLRGFKLISFLLLHIGSNSLVILQTQNERTWKKKKSKVSVFLFMAWIMGDTFTQIAKFNTLIPPSWYKLNATEWIWFIMLWQGREWPSGRFNILSRNGQAKVRHQGLKVFMLSATYWPADHEMLPARTVFWSPLCRQSPAQAGHVAVYRILWN